MITIIAQIIGFIGTVLLVTSYQINSHRGILHLQRYSGICFTIHFFMLGAYTGAVLNAVGIFRAIVFGSDKKWAKNPIWKYLISIAFAVVTIFTWEGVISALMIIIMTLATFGFATENNTKKRLLVFPASPVWLYYNFTNGSIPGTITEIMNIISLVVGIVRFDILKQSPQDNSKDKEQL